MTKAKGSVSPASPGLKAAWRRNEFNEATWFPPRAKFSAAPAGRPSHTAPPPQAASWRVPLHGGDGGSLATGPPSRSSRSGPPRDRLKTSGVHLGRLLLKPDTLVPGQSCVVAWDTRHSGALQAWSGQGRHSTSPSPPPPPSSYAKRWLACFPIILGAVVSKSPDLLPPSRGS